MAYLNLEKVRAVTVPQEFGTGLSVLRTPDGSEFKFTTDDFNSKDRAHRAADAHVAQWLATQEARAKRSLAPHEVAGMTIGHAPASAAERRQHEEQMARYKAIASPPASKLENLEAKVEQQQRMKALHSMSREEKALYYERRSQQIDAEHEAREIAESEGPSRELLHAQKIREELENDPLVPEVEVLKAREREAAAALSGAVYRDLEAAWRADRAKQTRLIAAQHKAEAEAAERAAREEEQRSLSYVPPKPVTVDTSTPTPEAAPPKPTSLASDHAKVGLLLAKTPETRALHERRLAALSDGSMTPDQYWAEAEPQA